MQVYLVWHKLISYLYPPEVAELEMSLDALRRQKHHLFQQFKETQCEEERRKMADWEEKMR